MGDAFVLCAGPYHHDSSVGPLNVDRQLKGEQVRFVAGLFARANLSPNDATSLIASEAEVTFYLVGPPTDDGWQCIEYRVDLRRTETL